MVHIPKRFPRWCVVLVVIGFALSGPLNADAQRRSKNSRVKSDSATHLRQGDKYFKQRRFTSIAAEFPLTCLWRCEAATRAALVGEWSCVSKREWRAVC